MKRIAAVLMMAVALPAFAVKEKKINPQPKEEAHPLTVTLDVKDAEVRDILKSMQRQCGIKNLAIDPNVQGKGTFFLKDIPCPTAFDLVLRTLRLRSVVYSNSLTAVEQRH